MPPLIGPVGRPYQSMKRIVIRRGRPRTFVYQGHLFALAYQGPGWGWEVRLGDLFGPAVADGMFTLDEVRHFFPTYFEHDEVQRHLPGGSDGQARSAPA